MHRRGFPTSHYFLMIEYAHIGNFQVSQAELVPLLKKYQLLPKILRELAIDRAIAPISCSDVERINALKQLCNREDLTSEQQLEQWLDLYGVDRQQLAEIAVRNLKIAKFKQATWGSKVEAYFLKRKSQLDRVIYSLIRTTELGVTQEIYFRATGGEQSFAELASRYSQGAESATGGLIGPVELGTPHPAIAHQLSSQPLGRICPPLQLEQWYIILRPEQLIPAQLDASMRQRLIDELFQTWLQEQIRSTSIPAVTSQPETPILTLLQ
jgi:parvulin-like peptidyl-prolyl isomerase